MARAPWWALAFGGGVAALVSVPEPAAAQSAPFDFTWNAPVACPSQADVLRSIEQLLGKSLRSELELPIETRAAVAGGGADWTVELTWRLRSGEQQRRQLRAASCAELARATALVIAFAIDPEHESAEPSPEPIATPAQEAPPTPPPTGPVAPAPRASVPTASAPKTQPAPPASAVASPLQPGGPARGASDSDDFHWSARAQLGLDFGSLPRPAPGVLLGASAKRRAFQLVLDLGVFAPQTESVPRGKGRFWLMGAALRPCYVFEGEDFALLPCAAAELSLIDASGDGVASPDRQLAGFARVGLGLEIAYRPSPRFSALAGGWAWLSPSRPRFVIADGALVHEPEAAGALAALGVQFEIF